MIRTQIYLSEQQRQHLASMAASTGENISALIREAIGFYLIKKKNEQHALEALQEEVFQKAFGMWRDSEVDFTAIRNSADNRD